MYDFDYQREVQIDQSIEEIRNFINILLTYEEEQTDTKEENFYNKIVQELSMAIFSLEAEKQKCQLSFA